MKIFTSVAPRRLESQKLALESWIVAGFQPVSINTVAEIGQLKPMFPELDFVPAGRDATGHAGKPLIYVDDLFTAVEQSGDAVCGLVNSDIIFRSKRNLPAWFGEIASAGLAFGSRLDIARPEDNAGQVYSVGYDYFFMNAATAADYPKTTLSMGAPMWDYWAALVPILRGRNCTLVNEVCAYHVSHEQVWDMTINIRMMKQILDHSGIEFEGIEGVDFSTSNALSKRVLNEFGRFIVPFLESRSKRLT